MVLDVIWNLTVLISVSRPGKNKSRWVNENLYSIRNVSFVRLFSWRTFYRQEIFQKKYFECQGKILSGAFC